MVFIGHDEDRLARVRGTQLSNISKYLKSVLNGFLYALETCLVNLELS